MNLSGITANAHRQYALATRNVENSMRKIAEGRPDLNTSDKARVGRMNTTLSMLRLANSTVKQSQDMLETAEDGIGSVNNVLTRLREIAVQSSNEDLTDDTRAGLVDEFNALVRELDYVAKNTAYDGVELLDGTFGDRDVIIEGSGDSDTINIELSDLTLDGLKLSAHTVTLEAGDSRIGQDNGQGGTYAEGDTLSVSAMAIDDAGDAGDALARIEAAIATTQAEASDVNSKIERFNFTISHLGNMISMNEESIATVLDFDEAAEMAALANYQIRQQTAIAIMAQAQQLSQTVMQLLQG
jgi:flagellin